MALQVLSVNVRPNRTWTPERPLVAARFAGGGEQRASLFSRTLRRYQLSTKLSAAEYATLRDFFEDRGWGLEAFLWQDLEDYERGTGSPGLVPLTALGSDVYQLPLTGKYGGDYPVDDGNVKVWDSLSAAQTIVATDTDARTIEVTAGGTPPMLADFHYYRRVTLVPGAFRDPIRTPLFDYDFELIEDAPHA